MPLWKIAWRSIQRRSLASVLTMLSMALGVMLVVAVLLIVGVVDESFRSNSSLGYDTIVGAKGGQLQLTLNTVYYLSQPVENLPFEYYEEFLPAEKRDDGRDGKFFKYLNPDVPTVPVCLGDYFDQYRVVGTTAELFTLVYDGERNRSYAFADGENFTGQKNGFEAILGAKVARDKGLKVGDMIQPAHGAPDGKAHDDFVVVGVLEPSGTPQDRAVFVNIVGFNSIADHIREDGKLEITAMLVDTKDPFRSIQLVGLINEGKDAQAVKPVATIFMLFSRIVGSNSQPPARDYRFDLRGFRGQHPGQHLQFDERPEAGDRRDAFAWGRTFNRHVGCAARIDHDFNDWRICGLDRRTCLNRTR